MNYISTVPAPVAACASGVGSFFGSCQIAAGNFDAALQSASFGFGSAQPLLSELVSVGERSRTPELLEHLQKIYGKEAGAEVFDIAVKIAKNNEILVELTPKERAAALKLQEAISQGAVLKPETSNDIIPLNMSKEDFVNTRLLATEMGIKPEDIPQFETLICNLLKSELITSQDLTDAVKISTQEFSDGSLGIFQEDLDAAESKESSPVRNALEELWSMMKGEPEINEEELPQKFEEVAKDKHFVKGHVPAHPLSHRIVHGHEHTSPPKVNIYGVEVTLQPVKILNHASEESHVHRVRGAIKVPNIEQNQNDLPKALFGLEMDFETGEFSIWENNKETGKPELIMKGAFNLKEGKLDVDFATKETAPIVGNMAVILKALYEKYIKLAKKDGEEDEKELKAPEAVVMQSKIAANNDLRDALIKGDQAAIEDALSRGADLSEAIKYDPVSQNGLSQKALLLNFFSEHATTHAMDQISLSQELENDDLIGSFFLLLKKVSNNGMLTKEEKAEINAYLENRITPEKQEEPIAEEKFVAKEKPEPNGRGVRPPLQEPIAKEKFVAEEKPVAKEKFVAKEKLEIPSIQPIQPKPAAAQAQPEVRAVWEGSDLKIEAFNPKTGEKLQTVSTRMPHAMQDRIHEFEVVKQVIAKAKLITTPTGDQRMTLQLRPDHLGQVDMRITLNHNEMQIQARVESPVAQAALETHIGLLREGLEKQGITLDRLEVSVEQRDKQDAFSLAERQDREEQRQHQRSKSRRAREQHLAVSISQKDPTGDTGRRLGYNSMEYLA
jgi:flagellar hook-length control protein FliK